MARLGARLRPSRTTEEWGRIFIFDFEDIEKKMGCNWQRLWIISALTSYEKAFPVWNSF